MTTHYTPDNWDWEEILRLEDNEKIHSAYCEEVTGKSHEIEPDDLDDFIYAVWFDEMPDDEEEARTFHNQALMRIADTVGIFLHDLRPQGSDCPDYDEVERRVNKAGLDTYNSDTRFIVFTPRPLMED
jgi:hypothetical protein